MYAYVYMYYVLVPIEFSLIEFQRLLGIECIYLSRQRASCMRMVKLSPIASWPDPPANQIFMHSYQKVLII